MTFDEIRPDYQRYVLRLSDKTEFIINGSEKIGITQSASQFVELRCGDIINKSYIVSIKKDKERTRENLRSLPVSERQLLTSI